MKKIFSVRGILTLFLLVSIGFAVLATYYKITHWGFSINPREKTDVWTIDAHITFTPIAGENIEISLATPRNGDEYKILSEDVLAKGYNTQKDNVSNRIKITSSPKKKNQSIYYRVMIYDNEEASGKLREISPVGKPVAHFEDEQQAGMAEKIWELAQQNEEAITDTQRIIMLFNQKPLEPEVDAFLPVKKSQRIMSDLIMNMLAYKGIHSRIIRGVKLNERKNEASADLMIESYENGKWMVYDKDTGEIGLPKDFVVFQRGDVSLLDVIGGRLSKIDFSVMKALSSSFKMAGRRAKYEDSKIFDYTIYNLPMIEQNTLKWLMIFPLGILLVVIMRNVIGISTMGTFTPMLIAMSLVKTGFIAGLLCYGLIIGLGLLLRVMLTKLNLLLVPRISAVVVFVILIMQMLTTIGYNMDFRIAESAVFFPIIITAWIIERASITWEEEGIRNSVKQIFNSVLVAIITYAVISSSYIRHIMFAFNEWNLVILFIIMLLGTYTGYRLTELKRFAPLIEKEKK